MPISTLDSWDYQIERYKYEKILGLKKFVWVIIAIILVLLMPSYIVGYYFASGYYKEKYSETNIIALPKSQKVEYTVTTSDTLQSITGERDLYTKIDTKKNKNLGYYPWVYTYKVYDKDDNVVAKDTISSFLLPDEETYVVVPIEDQRGIKMEIETDTTRSRTIFYDEKLPQYTRAPSVKITEDSFTINEQNNKLIDIKFSLINNNYLNIGQVDVYYILRGIDRNILGIGKYSFYDFNHGDTKSVMLKYPKPMRGTVDDVEIIPVINYLNPENVVPR